MDPQCGSGQDYSLHMDPGSFWSQLTIAVAGGLAGGLAGVGGGYVVVSSWMGRHRVDQRLEMLEILKEVIDKYLVDDIASADLTDRLVALGERTSLFDRRRAIQVQRDRHDVVEALWVDIGIRRLRQVAPQAGLVEKLVSEDLADLQGRTRNVAFARSDAFRATLNRSLSTLGVRSWLWWVSRFVDRDVASNLREHRRELRRVMRGVRRKREIKRCLYELGNSATSEARTSLVRLLSQLDLSDADREAALGRFDRLREPEA